MLHVFLWHLQIRKSLRREHLGSIFITDTSMNHMSSLPLCGRWFTYSTTCCIFASCNTPSIMDKMWVVQLKHNTIWYRLGILSTYMYTMKKITFQFSGVPTFLSASRREPITSLSYDVITTLWKMIYLQVLGKNYNFTVNRDHSYKK